jgi:hypothetical protein
MPPLKRDRGFESCSLHRRVRCEPNFVLHSWQPTRSPRKPASPAPVLLEGQIELAGGICLNARRYGGTLSGQMHASNDPVNPLPSRTLKRSRRSEGDDRGCEVSDPAGPIDTALPASWISFDGAKADHRRPGRCYGKGVGPDFDRGVASSGCG